MPTSQGKPETPEKAPLRRGPTLGRRDYLSTQVPGQDLPDLGADRPDRGLSLLRLGHHRHGPDSAPRNGAIRRPRERRRAGAGSVGVPPPHGFLLRREAANREREFGLRAADAGKVG